MTIGCTFCKSTSGAYAGQIGYLVRVDIANGLVRVGYKPKNGQEPYEIDAAARHYSFGYGEIRDSNNQAKEHWHNPWDTSRCDWQPYAKYYQIDTPTKDRLKASADIVGICEGTDWKVYEWQGKFYIINDLDPLANDPIEEVRAQAVGHGNYKYFRKLED